MRGVSLCSVTVNAGACAPAGETAAAPPSQARRASPSLTSEAVVESQREAHGLARRHGLREVQAEPAPIDAQPQIGEPTAEGGQSVRRQPARSVADEPPLTRVAKHDEVRPLEGEE